MAGSLYVYLQDDRVLFDRTGRRVLSAAPLRADAGTLSAGQRKGTTVSVVLLGPEIEAAGWFEADALPLPPPGTIARRLSEEFADRVSTRGARRSGSA